MWTTSITQITYLTLPNGLVRFHIDQPKQDTVVDDFYLSIAGWVLGEKEPIEQLQLVLNNQRISIAVTQSRPDVAQKYGQYPWAVQSGFRYRLPVQLTSGTTSLTISVMINDASIPVAIMEIHTQFVGLAIKPHHKPLMVTSLGRTGTTLCVSTLGHHPEVGITHIHPYEIRMGQEMIKHMLEALQIGNRPNLPRTLNRFFRQDYARQTIEHCINSIDHYYTALANENGQEEAHYFAEKFDPDTKQNWFYEFYPAAKEIFLVRDFRDMISSILAFNKKRGYDAFQRQKFTSDQDFIRHLNSPHLLLKDWQARKDRALLVTYEDFVQKPQETLTRICRYLHVDDSPKLIDNLQSLANTTSERREAHMTSASPTKSIGRWQHDLPTELIDLAHESFGEALTEFGYEVA
ncbi:MAG: sulfotransferase [Chloroflexota bacterium]